MGKIASRQSLAFSERNQLSQAIPQLYVERITNERQSRDPNRGTTNTRAMRTNFCVLDGDLRATNASDSNRGGSRTISPIYGFESTDSEE